MRNSPFMKKRQPQQSLLHNPLRQLSRKSFVEGTRVEIIGYTRPQQLQHKTFMPSIGPTNLGEIRHRHQILVTRLVCVCCSRESLQNGRFSIRTFWLRHRYLDSDVHSISIARQSAQSTQRERERRTSYRVQPTPSNNPPNPIYAKCDIFFPWYPRNNLPDEQDDSHLVGSDGEVRHKCHSDV